mgnify:CR=1 FL=1
MPIKTIKHKGLRNLWYKNNPAGIKQSLVRKVSIRLSAIDAATAVTDLANPAWRLHEHKGQGKGVYSLDVAGNWRILFKYEGGNAFDVDLDDPHS